MTSAGDLADGRGLEVRANGEHRRKRRLLELLCRCELLCGGDVRGLCRCQCGLRRGELRLQRPREVALE